MLVSKRDGCCPECSGQLEIVDADDCSMEVVCIECDEEMRVETDAFGDGGITYWPEVMNCQNPPENNAGWDSVVS